jgi:glycosyltransferase involved in cell wall biosynthesis
MAEKPIISVIMPVFNTEKYVAEAITSVLDQTYKNIELICIDDASTDGTLKVLQSFGDKIKILNNDKNSGIATSRNNGIRVAKGAFLALMDADDIWKPTKLEKQMEQFLDNPSLDISFCFMQCFLSPDLSEEVRKLRYCPPDPSPGYISATMLTKMESFKKVGYFDPKWRVGEFIDWYAKANNLGLKSGMVDKVLYLRRIHATNTGVTERPSRSDYLKIVKDAIDRKRNAK